MRLDIVLELYKRSHWSPFSVLTVDIHLVLKHEDSRPRVGYCGLGVLGRLQRKTLGTDVIVGFVRAQNRMAAIFGSSSMEGIERGHSALEIIHSLEDDLAFFIGLNGDDLEHIREQLDVVELVALANKQKL